MMPENKEVRKLELCDIAPYLPYGLRTDKGLLHALCNDGLAKCKLNDGEIVKGEISGLKPLLHPLSMLTQEITHNGETFIPIIELARIAESDHFYNNELKIKSGELTHGVGWLGKDNVGYAFCYSMEHNGFFLKSSPHQDLAIGNQLLLWAKLSEWFFDTRELLSSGLAIPIHNTK